MNESSHQSRLTDPEAGRSEPAASGTLATGGRVRRLLQSTPDTRRTIRRVLLLLGPVAVVLVGGYFYVTGGRYVSTEDAYVKADKVTVSAEVPGAVAEVMVRENEHVTLGAPLFRIDDRPYRVALSRAEAALQLAGDEIAALEAAYHEKVAALAVARSNAKFAEHAFQRQDALYRQKVASRARLDDALRNRDVARQQVAVVTQEIAQIAASLGGNPDAPVAQQARYLQAQAQRDRAALDLERTVVRAPFAGFASNVPKPGQHAAPGGAIMSVVADAGLWVDANFKEDALTYVAPGQAVTVEVDTYPGREWHGHVDSIAQATGAEFAILPPQNATGNWVKVVQRIPVRVAITVEPGAPRLRAGMSATVTVDTRHRRALFSMLASWFGNGGAVQAADHGYRR